MGLFFRNGGNNKHQFENNELTFKIVFNLIFVVKRVVVVVVTVKAICFDKGVFTK